MTDSPGLSPDSMVCAARYKWASIYFFFSLAVPGQSVKREQAKMLHPYLQPGAEFDIMEEIRMKGLFFRDRQLYDAH